MARAAGVEDAVRDVLGIELLGSVPDLPPISAEERQEILGYLAVRRASGRG